MQLCRRISVVGGENASSSFHKGMSKPGCIAAYLHIVWIYDLIHFWLVWKWTLRRPPGRRVSEGCTQKSRVCFEFLKFEFRNLKTHTMNFNFNINICSYWSTRIQAICADAGMQTGFSGGRRNESSSFHRGVSKPGCISAYLHIVWIKFGLFFSSFFLK